jgi:hypothetical protein
MFPRSLLFLWVFIFLCVFRVEATCPGWVEVPLDWNKTIKEYCAQYGEECRAVSMMYEPPHNEMSMDPVYAPYDDLILNHPDSILKMPGNFQAREIKCEELVLTPEMLAARASNEQSKKACVAKNGIWGRQDGRGQVKGCNLPTSDAGKLCMDSSECESACVLDKVTGKNKCYGWKIFKGCGKIVSKQVICLD